MIFLEDILQGKINTDKTEATRKAEEQRGGEVKYVRDATELSEQQTV